MSTITQFRTSGSHFEVGLAAGRAFAGPIERSLGHISSLQEQILPYSRTAEGQALYRQFLEQNQAHFPGYVQELEGLAQGAGRPFEELFLASLWGEYQPDLLGTRRGCSDCALLTAEAALFGHNEDGIPIFEDGMCFLHARIEDEPEFMALVYPGSLFGTAFGFNSAGICFSVNTLMPHSAGAGLGRQFIARSLLAATSLDDAIGRATVPGRVSGFSYNIGSIPERRIVHVEVAPQSFAVREVRGAYFHTNHYLELAEVEQAAAPSSCERVERGRWFLEQGLPHKAADILHILGDQTGTPYPIYRTATPQDPYVTFCTALFDLDARSLRIYTEHPAAADGEVLEFGMV